MARDEVPHLYKTDAADIHTIAEQYILTLSALPSDIQEEGLDKAILMMSTITVVMLTALGILTCICKR